MRAANSSGELRRVDSDFKSQLNYHCNPALLYGVPVLIGGLALLGASLSGAFGEKVVLMEALGGGLAAVGLILSLVRLGLIVDRKMRRVVRRRSLLCPLSSKVYNLSPFDFITIDRAGRGPRSRFEIRLSDSNAKFCVATFKNEMDAREFAGEVASFLNVRIVEA
jgi:hypothetical protein